MRPANVSLDINRAHMSRHVHGGAAILLRSSAYKVQDISSALLSCPTKMEVENGGTPRTTRKLEDD